MDTQHLQPNLDETGGDFYFADLFIESAKQAAAERGKQIPQRIIDEFYREVKQYRKRWERKMEERFGGCR